MTKVTSVSFNVLTMESGKFFVTVENEGKILKFWGPFDAFDEALKVCDELKARGQKIADKYWKSERFGY